MTALATAFNLMWVWVMVIYGANLRVLQVAAVARRPEVQVVLDAANTKPRVDESSNQLGAQQDHEQG